MNHQPFEWNAGALLLRYDGMLLQAEAWGKDSFRIRVGPAGVITDKNWALLPPRRTYRVRHELQEKSATLHNGKAHLTVLSDGTWILKNSDDQVLLHQEKVAAFLSAGGGLYKIEAKFAAVPDERIYGLGQHPHGFLDQKGCVIPLEQKNTQVSIPFYISSLGYGFLWNNPAIGQVELAKNGTRWVAEASPGLDCWITAAGSYKDTLAAYAEATGHAPQFPRWAEGFWQCKLRYRSQDELMAVAREYHRRGLPLSVIVIDYFHWTAMGDWQFDPVAWPDPPAMVRELAAMGVTLMVSVWPTVNAVSTNFQKMHDSGFLVKTARGVPAVSRFIDTHPEGPVYLHLCDSTHPGAREFMWNEIRSNYVSHGIKAFWLDACEPEINPMHHDNLVYYLGEGNAVGCIYPLEHAKAFHEGLTQAGEKEILTLCRSAWAGSQRYGAAVWSGDIASSFESLTKQVRAGLSMAMSGIPWWTADIGGFHGGDPESPEFRELIIRWFQYGLFCPIFRLHGVRIPASHTEGGPNEIWSFGDEALRVLSGLLQLREALRPYIRQQMRIASRTGLPPMRPVFVDFPQDANAALVEDAFLFGGDLLVAPVLEKGQRESSVILPTDSGTSTRWMDVRTGETHKGGQNIHVHAPLSSIPVFVKAGSALERLSWSAIQ